MRCDVWQISTTIRRRNDYITGFIAPAIGPNKSRKLTWLIAAAHNIRGKVWIKKQHTWLHRQTVIVCETMYFFIFCFITYINLTHHITITYTNNINLIHRHTHKKNKFYSGFLIWSSKCNTLIRCGYFP